MMAAPAALHDRTNHKSSDGLSRLQPVLKQEFFLALLGYSGSLFMMAPSAGPQPKVQLSHDLNWLSDLDRLAISCPYACAYTLPALQET